MSKVARAWQELDVKEGGETVEVGADGVGNAPDIAEAFKVGMSRSLYLRPLCCFLTLRGRQALQDGDEGVSVANLCWLMESAGLVLAEDDIIQMCQNVGAKRNENGTIPYASFVKLLLA